MAKILVVDDERNVVRAFEEILATRGHEVIGVHGAEEAMRRLAGLGVGTRPFFWPMHEQPVLLRMGFFRDIRCPVAERLARRGFYLPSGVALTESQLERSARALAEILR